MKPASNSRSAAPPSPVPLPGAAGQTPESVKKYYRHALNVATAAVRRGDGMWRGRWDGGQDVGVDDLATAVLASESRPAEVFKTSAINRTFRARLFGREVVVKRFGFKGPAQRLRYRFRASRGRRDHAAAVAMAHAGMPVPVPLGFLELDRDGLPRLSYALTEALPGARTARAWIRPLLHRHPDGFRQQVGAEIQSLLLDLYRLHIYHADTKTGNLLVTAPEDPEGRRWHWIDLDCVHFGCPPTRRRVLRNLVQLNGSLGSKLPDEDRFRFLSDLEKTFPWVADPGVAEHIRNETLRRLQRELEGTCGP